eukprot:957899-Pleurochrysis_carterae.AAC.1
MQSLKACCSKAHCTASQNLAIESGFVEKYTLRVPYLKPYSHVPGTYLCYFRNYPCRPVHFITIRVLPDVA